MRRSKVAPPGARLPLLIFAAALAAGAVLFVRVHRTGEAARNPPPYVATPATSAHPHLHGAP
ncbi:MAG TPA: hypothetical protein VFL83_02770 [Anaeromyxobacter sp.]|nr:hypothetical protein [Anaeromyxobacter sp.]